MRKVKYYKEDEALAFSDVYLRPSYSDIKSRFSDQINLSTNLAKSVPKLSIPIVASGMDTVTEHKMATVLALNGGIGEIHRNNTPKQQSHQIKLVQFMFFERGRFISAEFHLQ